MAILDIEQLRDALGVGLIYPDPDLQSTVDAASDVILAMLNFKRWPVSAVSYSHAKQQALYECPERHNFNIGDQVTLSTYVGSPFTGTQTIVAVTPYTWTTDKAHGSDHTRENVKPWGSALDNAQATLYDDVAEVNQAALAVAIDIWQQRMGTAAQQGPDFQVAPYRLGKSLYSRVSGLLAKHTDPGAFVG